MLIGREGECAAIDELLGRVKAGEVARAARRGGYREVLDSGLRN
jgi:hypothetical protein